jgi:E3 ubiquitin-protein ligase makorin
VFVPESEKPKSFSDAAAKGVPVRDSWEQEEEEEEEGEGEEGEEEGEDGQEEGYDNGDDNNDEDDIALCPYAMARGSCPVLDAGQDCEYFHGDLCPCCMRACLDPRRPEYENAAHVEACVAEMEAGLQQQAALEASAEVECNICLDRVLSKANPSERRFGLLEGCLHAFCLSCIRNWRTAAGQAETRSCPLCRARSYYVVPSA